MLKKAFLTAFPIFVGYFVVSVVFGLTAVNQGLPVWVPIVQSLLVFAGSSQFVVLPLIVSNAPIAVIVSTTFLLNSRHLLMSFCLSDILKNSKMSQMQRLFYAFGVTDESFALQTTTLKDQNQNPNFLISFQFFCYSGWLLGTVVGALLANLAQDFVTINLDYMLTAMMLHVLVLLIDNKEKIVIAIVAALSMCLLQFIDQNYFNIFIATGIACVVGTWKQNT